MVAAFPYYLLAALEAGKNVLVGAGLRSTVAAAVLLADILVACCCAGRKSASSLATPPNRAGFAGGRRPHVAPRRVTLLEGAAGRGGGEQRMQGRWRG